MGTSSSRYVPVQRSTSTDLTSLIPEDIYENTKLLDQVFDGLCAEIGEHTVDWREEYVERPATRLLGIEVLPRVSCSADISIQQKLTDLRETAKQSGQETFDAWFLRTHMASGACSSVINFEQTASFNGMFTEFSVCVTSRIGNKTIVAHVKDQNSFASANMCFQHLADGIKNETCPSVQLVYSQMVSKNMKNEQNLHRVGFLLESPRAVESSVVLTIYYGGHDWNTGASENLEIMRRCLASLLGSRYEIIARHHGGEALCQLGVQRFLRGNQGETLDQGFCQAYALLWLYFAVAIAKKQGDKETVHGVLDFFDAFFIQKHKGDSSAAYNFVLGFISLFIRRYTSQGTTVVECSDTDERPFKMRKVGH